MPSGMNGGVMSGVGRTRKAFNGEIRRWHASPLLRATAFLTIFALSSCGKIPAAPAPETAIIPDTPATTSGETTTMISVAPPPFSEGIFPCSRCHARRVTDPTRRELVWAHTEIVFEHDAEHRWCLDCHGAGRMDMLKLASGEPVPFAESYKLCGQCHGPTLRDWKAGAHGKRTGSWSGTKEYLLCVHCHDPHSPHFKPIAPMPPPVPPAELGRSAS